jgi:hypothetical protein
MAKAKTEHVCSECGGRSPRWQGQCPHCKAWNTLVESVVEPEAPVAKRFSALAGETGRLQTLADISPRESPRVPTGIAEFDRVLGGGLVPGGVVLIGGDPGIGKSTLAAAGAVTALGHLKALYVSGEESAEQVALRAGRLQLDAAKPATSAGDQPRAHSRHPAGSQARRGGDRLDPDHLLRDARLGPRFGGPGARMCRPAHPLRQAERHHADHGGPCDQGRCPGRAAGAGAHRRYGAVFRG